MTTRNLRSTSAAEYRLFIAIELPSPVTQALSNVQAALKEARPMRWVKPTQIHLTLQFLGNVPTTKIDDLAETLATAGSNHRPFTLTVQGVGAFPQLKRPRIIWAGVSGQTDPLHQLQADIVTGTQALGFTPDTRPFRAHLTLGRTDKRARAKDYRQISQVIRRQQAEIDLIATLPVRQVSLIRSQLKPHGPIYTPLATIKL